MANETAPSADPGSSTSTTENSHDEGKGPLLYSLVSVEAPAAPEKVTGMFLELSDEEINHIIESPSQRTRLIQEAIQVLQADGYFDQHCSQRQHLTSPTPPADLDLDARSCCSSQHSASETSPASTSSAGTQGKGWFVPLELLQTPPAVAAEKEIAPEIVPEIPQMAQEVAPKDTQGAPQMTYDVAASHKLLELITGELASPSRPSTKEGVKQMQPNAPITDTSTASTANKYKTPFTRRREAALAKKLMEQSLCGMQMVGMTHLDCGAGGAGSRIVASH